LNRRGFLSSLASMIAGSTLDPETLLWLPRRKTISIPEPANLCIRLIQTWDMVFGEYITRFDVHTSKPLRMPKQYDPRSIVPWGNVRSNLTLRAAHEEAALLFRSPSMLPTHAAFQHCAHEAIRRSAHTSSEQQFATGYWLRGEPPRSVDIVPGISIPLEKLPVGAAKLDPLDPMWARRPHERPRTIYTDALERDILRGIFLRKSLYGWGSSSERNFLARKHKAIYRAMETVSDLWDKPIEPATVACALMQTKELAAVGGLRYLVELSLAETTP
jgi:hypothetical protein